MSIVTTGKLEISPRFFNLVIPEFQAKGILTSRQATAILEALRQQGWKAAAILLANTLEPEKGRIMPEEKKYGDWIFEQDPFDTGRRMLAIRPADIERAKQELQKGNGLSVTYVHGAEEKKCNIRGIDELDALLKAEKVSIISMRVFTYA